MSGVVYIGVDPGVKGAICFLRPGHENPAEFLPLDMPANWLYAHIITELREDTCPMVMIEDVHSLHGMSAKSNFNFGRNVGTIHGVFGVTGLGIDTVQPKEWQKVVGVKPVPTGTAAKRRTKIQKQNVADKCAQLYPNVVIHGPNGGLQDGKSDSLLIAHYCYLKYGSAGLV